MASKRTALNGAFAKRLLQLEATRRRVERAALGRRLTERLYEGIYVAAFSSFEGYIEDVFFALLSGGRSRGIQPRVDVRSHAVAREIVFGGKKYVDWLPYEATEQRARVFFRGGKPFSSLTAADKEVLLRCQAIRNVIAHRSRHSRERFEARVLQNVPLPPRERTPAGYLRSPFAQVPPSTRFESLLGELRRIANLIATS